jgi:hypothetical protein
MLRGVIDFCTTRNDFPARDWRCDEEAASTNHRRSIPSARLLRNVSIGSFSIESSVV